MMVRDNRGNGGCSCGSIAIVLLLAIIGFGAYAYWQIDRGTPGNVPGYAWLVSNLNGNSGGDNPAGQSAAATAASRPTATPRSAITSRTASLSYNTQNIRWARQSHSDLYQAITRLPWVSDGLDDADKAAVDEILYIAVEDAATAKAVVAMPFLQTNDAAGRHALESVNDLLRAGNEPALRDSRIYQFGITGEWAPVVAAAGTLSDADAVAEYLDGQASIQQENYATDYTTNLAITVVRPAGNAAGGVNPELVAMSVRLAENIMRMPLPTDNVIVVVDDRAATGGFFGTNHGFAIGLQQEAETKSPERLLNTLVHEVAHYWWRSNADWIDEGVADTIAATASEQQGHTFAASPNRRQDCDAVNISNIGNAARSNRGRFYCNYYLGEKLFRALQDDAGPSDFVAGLQRLYQLSRAMPAPQTRQDYRAGIAQVLEAFPDSAAIINRHWNGDLNAPHRWDPDDNLSFTAHNAVVWTQKPTYDGGIVRFAGYLQDGASLVSTDESAASQFGGSANFTINDQSGDALGSILIPLTGNRYWNLDDPGDVIAEQYSISDGQFEIRFRWPDALGDYADKHITVWGYNNAERTPVINSRTDPLGQSMVRLYTQPTAAATRAAPSTTAMTMTTPAPTVLVPTATPSPTATPRPTYTPRPTPMPHNTQNMRWVPQSHPGLYDAIAGLPWVRDGLNDADKAVIDEILYIAVEDSAVAKAVVAMPFLQINDAASLHALESVNDILYAGNESTLRDSRMYQSGITGEWAPVVAAAGTVSDADAVAEYLDGQVSIRQERYDTDYTQNLTVTIVRPAGNAGGGVNPDLVEKSIRLAENIMRMPLPTDNVIVVIDDRSGTGEFFGINHGFAIGVKQQAETVSAERLLNLLVHEVAHYWWSVNPNWLDEGIADTIAATASAQQGHTAFASPNLRDTCTAINIRDIRNVLQSNLDQFHCNYYLGEKLFRELQENTTVADFAAALQQLYQIRQEQTADRYGIEHVRAAFPNHTAIIDRHWSGDLNAPHRWDPDDSLNFRSHNAVVWTKKPTYRDGRVSFSGYLQDGASLNSLDDRTAMEGICNFSIYDSSGKWLGSIIIPLTDGSYWTLDDPGDVVADRYAVAADGRFDIAFWWPDAIGDYADKHITVWGYNNAERTPTITRYADPLGQSTVR